MCWAHGGKWQSNWKNPKGLKRSARAAQSRTVDLNHISVDLIDQDRDFLKDYHRAEVRRIYVKFIIGLGEKSDSHFH